MGLSIKNLEVERLAAEAARMFGESKTEAVKVSLQERIARSQTRLSPAEKLKRLNRFLETQVWPSVRPEFLGKPVTREEREEILGIGPDGY